MNHSQVTNCKSTKLLENVVEKSLGLRARQRVLRLWSIKNINWKFNQFDFIKIKYFCSMRHHIEKLKRKDRYWEKIFVSYISDKGLISNIYKELSKPNSKQHQE